MMMLLSQLLYIYRYLMIIAVVLYSIVKAYNVTRNRADHVIELITPPTPSILNQFISAKNAI